MAILSFVKIKNFNSNVNFHPVNSLFKKYSKFPPNEQAATSIQHIPWLALTDIAAGGCLTAADFTIPECAGVSVITELCSLLLSEAILLYLSLSRIYLSLSLSRVVSNSLFFWVSEYFSYSNPYNRERYSVQSLQKIDLRASGLKKVQP